MLGPKSWIVRLADIPRPHVPRAAEEQIKLLLRAAPRCLQYLLEHNIIFINRPGWPEDAPTDIRLLSGGVNAVAYLVRHSDWSVVVKLDYRSMRAEAEALAAWRRRGAAVAKLLAAGEIPFAIGAEHSVRFVLLEGIMAADGKPAPLAIDHIMSRPSHARVIGQATGQQLALMHGATTRRTFGEFSDMKGHNTKPYGTFNAYLNAYLGHFKPLLLELGYSQTRYRALRRYLRRITFPRTGRYVHGDPSPRNILLTTLRPLRITLIDPNPLIGHPAWDLAIIANNAELSGRKAQLRPGNGRYAREAQWRGDYWAGVMSGYHEASKRRIHRRHLELVRLVHLLALTDIAISAARAEGRDLAEDATVRAHCELLADLTAAILTPPDAKG